MNKLTTSFISPELACRIVHSTFKVNGSPIAAMPYLALGRMLDYQHAVVAMAGHKDIVVSLRDKMSLDERIENNKKIATIRRALIDAGHHPALANDFIAICTETFNAVLN